MLTNGIHPKRSSQPSTRSRQTKRVAFLDRDGVINKEKEYLFRWDDFEYLPGSLEALQKLTNDPNVFVVVATGQSGIGRGKYSECDFQLLTNKMRSDLLQKCIYVDGVWYCPHLSEPERHQAVAPYNVPCTCRKPSTGLIDSAVEYFQKKGHVIDLANSCVIGDKTADVKMAENAGCKGILVQTGYGGQEANDRYPINPDYKAENLLAGVNWWLGK
ncbi:D-glycero-alpha-D-manno-heptose-1,7-bisphosphate 7-phosphatase [Patescibacteria group bacterium]